MSRPSIRLLAATVCVSIFYMSQIGYHDTVFNVPADKIRDFINASYLASAYGDHSESTSTFLWSLAVGVYSIGMVVGGLCVGYLADKLGRKNCLLVVSTTGLILGNGGMVLATFLNVFELVIVGRFINGFACSTILGAGMLWLMESSPQSYEALIGRIAEGVENIGMLLAQILALPKVLGSQSNWCWLFGFSAAVAIPGAVLCTLFPDSPKHLYTRHAVYPEVTARAIKFYYGVDCKIEAIIQQYGKEKFNEQQVIHKRVSLGDFWNIAHYRYPIIISILLNLLPATSGWFVISVYSTTILKNYHLTEDVADVITIAIMVVNVIAAVLSPVVIKVTRRRPLFVISSCVTLAITTVVALAAILSMYNVFGSQENAVGYLIGGMFVLFSALYFLGFASLCFILPVEISPQEIRSTSMACSVASIHMGMFISQVTFDVLFAHMRGFYFLLFPVLSIPIVIYLVRIMPESKDKHLSEILSSWRQAVDGSESHKLPSLSVSELTTVTRL